MMGPAYPRPAQCLGGLVTIQHRHLHVHQNHVERLLGIEVALAPARKGVQRPLHGLMAVFADMDFGPHLRKMRAMIRWLSGPSSARRIRQASRDWKAVAGLDWVGIFARDSTG